MKVLGITDGITCGAAIVEDGEILAAVNEESLVRLKMAYGFPRQAIREVMASVGLQPDDIDLVTVATNNNHFFDGIRAWDGWFQRDAGSARNTIFMLAGRAASLAVIPGVEQLYYTSRSPIFAQRRRRIGAIVAEEFGIRAKVQFVNHHLAHCTSAYFTSGFDNALVVSMDGGGDGDSSHIYTVEDGMFRRVGHTSAFHSVGNYYSYVTEVCGFKAQKHEGKITGLAAAGEPKYLDLLDSLITFSNGQLRNNGRVVFAGGIAAIEKKLPRGWRREDLAASIQIHCEDLVVRYVTGYLARYPRADLAIAGGLFANVRINQRLAEIPGIERLWVHPGMSDAGLAVGSALATCMKNRKALRMAPRKSVLGDVYLGPSYSELEIASALSENGLEYSRSSCVEKEIARLLAEGYVVARFNECLEYGPRALGNRSILYHPADRSVNDWLNRLLVRTEFMPFAPSTNIEHAADFYLNVEPARDSARFMTVTFDCTDWMKSTCPGVVHLDGTARPQLVRKEDNPSYHRIIEEFGKLTGVSTIINTSFNMHEEPIVCSPQDAIRAFRLGHLDYLALGDLMVKSPEPIKHELRPMVQVRRPATATV